MIDKRMFKPNGDMRQCQCVMSHTSLIDGAIKQCIDPRWAKSNAFCEGCEKTHGDAAERRGEKVIEEER